MGAGHGQPDELHFPIPVGWIPVFPDWGPFWVYGKFSGTLLASGVLVPGLQGDAGPEQDLFVGNAATVTPGAFPVPCFPT